MATQYVKGQTVHFRLDGRWEGEGVVTHTSQTDVSVVLTTPCKEFKAGEELSVSNWEIHGITEQIG